MSTASVASSSIDSNATSRCNHRHHRPVVGEEALLMKPAGASGGSSNEGSREGSMTIDWDKATERHRVQDMIHSKASSTSSSPPFAAAPSSSVTPSLGNSGEIAYGFVSHLDATSNIGGGGGGELGAPAVGPPVNQGRPTKNWRVSKEAASLLACQGNKNKAAKGAEAYSVAHCLEVPSPSSGDARGVSKQTPETVGGKVSALEQRCLTGEGRVDKDLLLSELLVELHRRVKLLVGLQRQKRNQQRRTRVEPLMPLMPRQAAAPAAPASPEEMAEEEGEGDELYGLEALEFFKRIRSLGAYPPPTLCSLLVQLLAAEGMLEEAEEQFADMLKYGMLPSESCATMVIRLRVQRGKLAEAMEVLAMMEGREYQKKFCRPRFRSYQPVICELLRRGEMDGVMQLWKHMEWHSIRPKESFLLDLIEGIAKNHQVSSRDSLAQLADHLLDGMSKTLIYPSAPTVKTLVEGWNAKWTDVSEQGTCTTCGEMLQGTRLTPEDRARMRSSIVRIAAQNGAREVQRLSWFANWFCSLEDPPTAIIDGPNVGFMNQNFKEGGFSLTQVDWLAEHLKSKGERVLITMPWYYCKDDNFPMRADRRESPESGVAWIRNRR
ncbi:conserved unknown protein [Ectocarpus siliculosus]|uniref:PROP1-like PPR domain-containing protein n=1 Tax=Ectocarpus siliculosus TaxID=2880 RepID=D7FNA1_ECTSI|nr:conserved unknown protein [Ectocarpus siliculosus]|eukprot:CBJ30158.1 conserved unknown protein [Ectocarpus siliculosus]